MNTDSIIQEHSRSQRHFRTFEHAMPARLKFLVVEDDFSLQPIWEGIIRQVDPNAIIRWARSEEGAEALVQEWLERGTEFDFIVADVALAGEKTGIDLWRRYRGGETLFLFETSMTAKRFTQEIGERESEYPVMLRKPLNVGKCVETVKTMLTYKDDLTSNDEDIDEEYLQ